MSAARPHDWDDPVCLPPVQPPSRVLVAFDGSHNSERALAWAAIVAAASSVEVLVVVAYEQPMTMRGRGALYVDDVRDHLEEEAKGLATEAVTLANSRGLRARGIVVKGDVANAILDVAEAEECDLIMVGRQGISAEIGGVTGALDRVRDLLQGGVSAKLVRHAAVPVLVVP